MAVMTTQRPDGVLLEEKPLKMAQAAEKQIRNGALEVNGHAAPGEPKGLGLGSENVINHKDEAKLEQNEDAFLMNQTVDAAPNGTAQKDDSFSKEPAQDVSKQSEALGADESVLADSIMTDTPAKSPASPVEEGTMAALAADVPAPTSPHSAVDSPVSSILSPVPKEDVVMGDAQPQTEPSFPPDQAESTQDTAISDMPPATPSEDANTVGPRRTTADAPQVSPTAPATADTSLSEPSQPVIKFSRERDSDSEDEPVAKRARVEQTADQVEVKTTREMDRMDMDQAPTSSSSLHDSNGEPKNLADPSLDGNPITDYMSRQLRMILAGVKKTKAGLGFRQSVKELWPQLWEEYSAKILRPMDISYMEKKLRGELPRYATMADFKSDVDLLVANSATFNGELHEVTIAARSTREAIFTRMAAQSAVEPAKPEKKETTKQHPTRHAEPRTTAQPAQAASPRRPPKPAGVEAAPKPVVESPAFAIPANNNGVPLIRRDSTKGDGRAKRPVKPALPKDLVYDTKRKKKLPPELRFCDEVLTEIRKQKYYDINGAFLYPVDPVALNIPSYHKVIKKPMDLQTMGNKMNAGEYTSAKEFEKDFDLIVKNCRLFNGEEHPVYDQALRLQQLFKKELSRKDDWMAKHVPVAAPLQSNTSPAPKDESEEEERESEAEPEADEEQKASQHRLATIQKRLEEEQKKVNDMINTGTAEMADVEIAQSVVAMLQKQLMGERAKLAALQAKKPVKAKPSKPKKSSGAVGGGKKASGGAAGSGGTGPTKKASGGRKAPKRKIGALEKEVIASGIAELDGHVLERAIDIIKKDTGQGENDSGELELDIEQLSDEALVRLYDLVTKAFPNLKAEKEKSFAAPPAAEPVAPKPKGVAKSKKNKPMSRVEQERRLQQLTELRAQAGRQASGSQEPMESIEGNGNGNVRASMDPAPHANVDSDDEESSEEE